MLRIDLEYRKGILFVRLNGELNKNTVKIFREEVTEKILTNGINNVAFNLENLDNIDLKGINSLIYNYKLCVENGGNALICSLKNENIENKLKKFKVFKYIKNINTEIDTFEII